MNIKNRQSVKNTGNKFVIREDNIYLCSKIGYTNYEDDAERSLCPINYETSLVCQ